MAEMIPGRVRYFYNVRETLHDREYFMQYLYHFFIKPGGITIDVGANIGLHTVPLAKIAKNTGGKVYAFEANASLLEKNRKSLRAMSLSENAELIHAAVTTEEICEKSPTADFTVFTSMTSRSGLQRNPHEKLDYVVITVPTTTLDRSIPNHDTVSFIKIDVEGGDFHVLQGATDILRRSKPIVVFEFARQHSADLYGFTQEDFFTFFRNFNYRIFNFSGSEFTESCWEQDVHYSAEYWAVHDDSPFGHFFEHNLPLLADCYYERQLALKSTYTQQALQQKCGEDHTAITMVEEKAANGKLVECQNLYRAEKQLTNMLVGTWWHKLGRRLGIVKKLKSLRALIRKQNLDAAGD